MRVHRKFTWQDVADAANTLYVELNPSLASIENPCLTVFNNNLPKMCADVIVDGTIKYKSVHNSARMELLAMALVQVNTTGKIENI